MSYWTSATGPFSPPLPPVSLLSPSVLFFSTSPPSFPTTFPITNAAHMSDTVSDASLCSLRLACNRCSGISTVGSLTLYPTSPLSHLSLSLWGSFPRTEELISSCVLPRFPVQGQRAEGGSMDALGLSHRLGGASWSPRSIWKCHLCSVGSP